MPRLSKESANADMNRELEELDTRAKKEYWPKERVKLERDLLVSRWQKFIRKNCR